MDEIDKAIEVLTKKIVPAVKADEALKYTHAALHLAHTKSLLEANKKKG